MNLIILLMALILPANLFAARSTCGGPGQLPCRHVTKPSGTVIIPKAIGTSVTPSYKVVTKISWTWGGYWDWQYKSFALHCGAKPGLYTKTMPIQITVRELSLYSVTRSPGAHYCYLGAVTKMGNEYKSPEFHFTVTSNGLYTASE